jgi:hypothetical protein
MAGIILLKMISHDITSSDFYNSNLIILSSEAVWSSCLAGFLILPFSEEDMVGNKPLEIF